MDSIGRHAFPRDARRLAQPGNQRGGQCARTAIFLPSAVQQRRDHGERPAIQRAHALGAINLVGSEAHQVDAHRVDVQRHLAETLRRIDVEYRAHAVRQRRNRRQILHHADLVIDRHHRYQRHICAQRALQIARINQAIFAHRHHGKQRADAGQILRGFQHG